MEIILVLVAVTAAFYYILLRPVLRQQRQQRRDISSLQIGDEVLTTGGFYATVNEINTFDDRPMEIVLEAAPGVLLRGTTAAVVSVARRPLPAQPAPDKDAGDAEEDDDDDDEWDDDDDDDWDEDEDDWDDDDEEEDWDDEDEDDEDEDEPANRLGRPATVAVRS